MRISTANRHDETVASLQRRQNELSEAQTTLTTGKRISRASDDPTGAARAERAFIAQQRIGSEQRSVAASRSAMSLAESTLGQSVDLLQRAREGLVAAGNGSYSSNERAALVADLRNLRGQLLGLANREDGAGGHVFGGQTSSSVPFQDMASGVTTAAAGGRSELSSREQMPATLDGAEIWLRARSGNGVFVSGANSANTGQGWINPGSVSDPAAITGDAYTLEFRVDADATRYTVLRNGSTVATDQLYQDGKAITVDGMTMTVRGSPATGDRFELTPATATLNPFAALDQAIAALGNASAGDGQVAQAVANGLRDMDAVLGHVQAARSDAGAALTRLDAIDGRNQDSMLWAQTVQADAEDADMVAAVSAFQNKQTGYQAALQSYSMVQRMSFLDYLK